MWRYGAMALVALTFSNENILFLRKISTHTPRHIKKTSQVNFARFFLFVTPTGLITLILVPATG